MIQSLIANSASACDPPCQSWQCSWTSWAIHWNAAAAAASCDPSLRRACRPPPRPPLAKVLALKVVAEVEGASEVLAAAAAPQFGSNLLQVPLFVFARGFSAATPQLFCQDSTCPIMELDIAALFNIRPLE